jgi:galactonate dehydratase
MMYRGAYFEGGRIMGAVTSAVDMALWDILGKSFGVPVYQLLGGATRDSVPCFATAGLLNGAECVRAAQALAGQGWRYVRFLPGMPLPADAGADWLAQVQAPDAVYEPMESIEAAAHWLMEARRAVGPRVELSVDMHHRYSVGEAASFCDRVRDARLMFVEEPLRAESPKAYEQLRRLTTIPFAIGEEFASKWEFAPFVEGGLLEYARVDVSIVGGLSEAKKVAGWCEAHYIDVMPHNPLGPICTAATVHLGASISNFAQLEYRGELAATWPRDLFPVVPEIAGDSFPLPTAAGLGVSFDVDAVKAHPYRIWEPPHWRRRDGSHTNR